MKMGNRTEKLFTIEFHESLALSSFFWLLLMLFLVQDCSFLVLAAGSPVKFLPGFDGPLPFELETGWFDYYCALCNYFQKFLFIKPDRSCSCLFVFRYIGVDEAEDTQLFYYFVKSQSNPQVDPLILWMTGGPGCTSLTGFLYEIGKFHLFISWFSIKLHKCFVKFVWICR